ncbi:hypothetical protein [Hydrogenophaga sp. NFH-34]|uniref:hypothetical protein n=1 Tax=Hydrogenophaga sp. NFH-34 TaxID=2744446 RepID=UPI001F3451C0|nr:hypothetical protein [Hydrogenophaga sp. NFH-34]
MKALAKTHRSLLAIPALVLVTLAGCSSLSSGAPSSVEGKGLAAPTSGTSSDLEATEQRRRSQAAKDAELLRQCGYGCVNLLQ